MGVGRYSTRFFVVRDKYVGHPYGLGVPKSSEFHSSTPALLLFEPPCSRYY